MRIHTTKRRGISLLEVVISIMLVSIVLIGSLRAASTLLLSRYVDVNRIRGELLAEVLMTEILNQSYEDAVNPVFGMESGENTSNRNSYDDVDDYQTFTESPPRSSTNVALSGFGQWTWTANVQWVDPVDLATPSASETDVKKISVTANTAGIEMCRLVAFRTINYEAAP